MLTPIPWEVAVNKTQFVPPGSSVQGGGEVGSESKKQMKISNCKIVDQWQGRGVEAEPVAWPEGSKIEGLKEAFRNKRALCRDF